MDENIRADAARTMVSEAVINRFTEMLNVADNFLFEIGNLEVGGFEVSDVEFAVPAQTKDKLERVELPPAEAIAAFGQTAPFRCAPKFVAPSICAYGPWQTITGSHRFISPTTADGAATVAPPHPIIAIVKIPCTRWSI